MTAPALTIEVLGAEHELHAAQPTLRLDMGIAESAGVEVHAITLTAQVMLEPARRRYDDVQRAALSDLFGEPGRWPATTHAFLWTFVGATLHGFSGTATFALPIPCTADLELSASRYIDALGEGEIPIALHFSGRVLYAGDGGRIQVAHIGWDTMARHALDFGVWRRMIHHHHGDMRFVRLHRDTLAALTRRKSDEGCHTYDDVVEHLLEGAPQHVGE